MNPIATVFLSSSFSKDPFLFAAVSSLVRAMPEDIYLALEVSRVPAVYFQLPGMSSHFSCLAEQEERDFAQLANALCMAPSHCLSVTKPGLLSQLTEQAGRPVRVLRRRQDPVLGLLLKEAHTLTKGLTTTFLELPLPERPNQSQLKHSLSVVREVIG